MPLLPSRHLDTVALFAEYRKGRIRYAATGFFCRHRFGGEEPHEEPHEELFLVTSAHNVREEPGHTLLVSRRRRTQHVLLNDATGQGGLGRGPWISDPESDLAALPLNPEHLAATKLRFRALGTSASALTMAAMRKRRIGEGDDVLVIGFAPELAGLHPVPLVRRGIVARIQDCYRGLSKTFLVEATTFAGNRGSPVVMKPDRGADDRAWNDPAGKLIGVVSESVPNPLGPLEHGTDGRTVLIQVNTGLVRVVPVDALLDLLEKADAQRHASPQGASSRHAPPTDALRDLLAKADSQRRASPQGASSRRTPPTTED